MYVRDVRQLSNPVSYLCRTLAYLCDLFLIFITIIRIISLIQTHLFFFAYFLEYILLILDGNVDEECE